MPVDKLMRICLDCDHCRIKFKINRTVHELLTRKIRLFNRNRIIGIWCAKGVFVDGDGMPKKWTTQMSLLTAQEVTGVCPFYSPDDAYEDYEIRDIISKKKKGTKENA